MILHLHHPISVDKQPVYLLFCYPDNTKTCLRAAYKFCYISLSRYLKIKMKINLLCHKVYFLQINIA